MKSECPHVDHLANASEDATALAEISTLHS